MWKSRTKTDLIIEVWEALDCESIGAKEITEIIKILRENLGNSSADTPMAIARLLVNEGAELRHSEIMELHIRQFDTSEYAAMFRNLMRFDDLDQARSTIRNLENLRKKFESTKDKEGLRLLKEKVLTAKQNAVEAAKNDKFEKEKRVTNQEISEWLTIWLQTPEVFESWVTLRQRSPNFKKRFYPETE